MSHKFYRKLVTINVSSPILAIIFLLALVIYKQTNLLLRDSDKVFSDAQAVSQFVWSEEFHIWALNDAAHSGSNSTYAKELKVWPDCDSLDSDRIVEQLMLSNKVEDKVFKIYPPNDHLYPIGDQMFKECSIDKCQISYDKEDANALIFLNSDVKFTIEELRKRRSDQIWVAYLLESPLNTFDRKFKRSYRGNKIFNWTATYRSDSDLVTPYSKFVPFSSKLEHFNQLIQNQNHNYKLVKFNELDLHLNKKFEEKFYKSKKSKKIAWFVSNCQAANNRLEYAQELAKYIQVDIYGKCGNFTCDKRNQLECKELINQNYKYYLSFENSNCKQYITEKLFNNAHGYNDLDYYLLPIVMGPTKEDYVKFAPPNSFIHVDDFKSPKELATYLLNLSDDLYLTYFQWKFVGKFIDTKFMCRLCAMLHHNFIMKQTKSYTNIENWWNNFNQTESCS